jgi:hypothetical protein
MAQSFGLSSTKKDRHEISSIIDMTKDNSRVTQQDASPIA